MKKKEIFFLLFKAIKNLLATAMIYAENNIIPYRQSCNYRVLRFFNNIFLRPPLGERESDVICIYSRTHTKRHYSLIHFSQRFHI